MHFSTSNRRIDQKKVRNRQSTLPHALGNAVPINTIENLKARPKKRIQFSIDSPPDKTTSSTKPSLISLIQELGFTDKTPEYQAFMKFLEAISPKIKDKIAKKTEIVDLISPVESPVKDKTEILFIDRKSGESE